jgi:flagellar basal-body rod modification protein FlgD
VLPTGADGVNIDVMNSSGEVVRSQTLGAQPIGDLTWTWNGANNAGTAVAEGPYTFRVSGTSQGKNIAPTVNLVSTIRSISQGGDGALTVEVQGGKSISLADVKRIGG